MHRKGKSKTRNAGHSPPALKKLPVIAGFHACLFEGLESRALFSACGLSAHAQAFVHLTSPAADYVPGTGYSPDQVRSAYGFNQVAFSSGSAAVPGNGQGQTIA